MISKAAVVLHGLQKICLERVFFRHPYLTYFAMLVGMPLGLLLTLSLVFCGICLPVCQLLGLL